MKSIDARQQELIKDILFMKRATPDQIRKITMDGMKTYFKALAVFGPSSPITKEALVTIREMYEISKVEGKLLNFITSNLASIDISAAESVVLTLDKLNDDTYAAYDSVLGEIEIACDTKNPNRTIKPKSGINSLITNENYKTMVVSLTERMIDVRAFLTYEEDFWTFIETYLKVVPSPGYIAEKTCGLRPILDQDGNLVNFYTIVPKVVDLDTAMIAIDVYKRAHDLYNCLSYRYKDILKPSSEAVQEEYKEHLDERAKMIFK